MQSYIFYIWFKFQMILCPILACVISSLYFYYHSSSHEVLSVKLEATGGYTDIVQHQGKLLQGTVRL